MRILVVSDLHYSLKQFDWLCLRAGDYDLLAIAGDLLDLGGHADLGTQSVVVEKYLARLAESAPLVVCSGNHDLDDETDEGERFAAWLKYLELNRVSVDLQSMMIGDCLVSMCAWWEGPVSREEIAQFLEAESAKRTGRWIWLYHAPPDGAKISWTGKDYKGDTFLPELIAKHNPDIVFCGHIHNSPFRKEGSWHDRIGSTWVFNAGRQMSSTPSTIMIDVGTMQATWDSDMDVETIELTAN